MALQQKSITSFIKIFDHLAWRGLDKKTRKAEYVKGAECRYSDLISTYSLRWNQDFSARDKSCLQTLAFDIDLDKSTGLEVGGRISAELLEARIEEYLPQVHEAVGAYVPTNTGISLQIPLFPIDYSSPNAYQIEAHAREEQRKIIKSLISIGIGADEAHQALHKFVPNVFSSNEKEITRFMKRRDEVIEKKIMVLTELSKATKDWQHAWTRSKKNSVEVLHPHARAEASLVPVFRFLLKKKWSFPRLLSTKKLTAYLSGVKSHTVRRILSGSIRLSWLSVERMGKGLYEVSFNPTRTLIARAKALLSAKKSAFSALNLPHPNEVLSGSRNEYAYSIALALKRAGVEELEAANALHAIGLQIPSSKRFRGSAITSTLRAIYRTEVRVPLPLSSLPFFLLEAMQVWH